MPAFGLGTFAAANSGLAPGVIGLGLVLASGLALAAARFGAGQTAAGSIGALAHAAERLRAGDLGARAGLPHGDDDLGLLARAFDDLAECMATWENQRLKAEEMRDHALQTEAVLHSASRFNAAMDLPVVLDAVCEEAASAVGIPAATIWLHDAQRDALEYAWGVGLPPEYGQRASPLPRPVYQRYLRQPGLSVIPDLQAVPDLPDALLCAELNLRTVAGVSLLREQQLIGILEVMTLGETRSFTDGDLALLRSLAELATPAIARARLLAESRRASEYAKAVGAVGRGITDGLDLRHVLGILLEQVISRLSIDATHVLLHDHQGQTLASAAGRGLPTDALAIYRSRFNEGPSGRVIRERRTIFSSGVAGVVADPSRATPPPTGGLASCVGVPIIAGNRVKGTLEIFHRTPVSPHQELRNILEILASQMAVAMDNLDRPRNLQRPDADLVLAYDATLEVWARALELRGLEPPGHSDRVARTTVRLGRGMGMSEADLVHIRRGALLHDVGKMGVPDSILLKPGPLDPNEWDVVRRHPTIAYLWLRRVAFLRQALDIPHCHHEKWDGSGYPRGLRGEQIPLAARAFAVVDVWDTLSFKRAYQGAWAAERVRAYLQEQAGVHFDPRAVEIFLRLLAEDDRAALEDERASTLTPE